MPLNTMTHSACEACFSFICAHHHIAVSIPQTDIKRPFNKASAQLVSKLKKKNTINYMNTWLVCFIRIHSWLGTTQSFSYLQPILFASFIVFMLNSSHWTQRCSICTVKQQNTLNVSNSFCSLTQKSFIV